MIRTTNIFSMNKRKKINVINSGIMAAVILITGCSSDTNVSSSETSSSTSISFQETQSTTEATIIATPTPVVYDFIWDDYATVSFDKYIESKYFGTDLSRYVALFGFDKGLENTFTDFVNQYYGKDYSTVPFSTAKYFRTYLVFKSQPYQFRDNYDAFSRSFFNSDQCSKGTFNNKLIMSYLIHNNIRFGEKIPSENFLNFYGSDIYTFDYFTYLDTHRKTGNYESSYIYCADDLALVLIEYNNGISRLCNDERIAERNLFSTEPDSIEACEKAREMYQEYLNEYYGENAPQFGVVPTIENYNAMFPGEDLVDISYIDGAIYDPNNPLYTEDDINVPIPTVESNDAELIGEWTGYVGTADFTYIYVFNEDSTGTYTSIHSTSDYQSGTDSQQINTVDFTYSAQLGVVTIEFSNGNSIRYTYDISGEKLILNGVEYNKTKS